MLFAEWSEKAAIENQHHILLVAKAGEPHRLIIEIIQNKIYINEKKIDDPWGHYDERSQSAKYLHPMEKHGPFFVPKGFLFVLGDNRDNSEDSRFWGFLNMSAVLGKAFIIYFSWDWNAENLFDEVRWSRMGKLIHLSPSGVR